MTNSFLQGTIVPIPAFFNEDLSLDLTELERFLNFLIDNSVTSFYSALSASQLEFMSPEERIYFNKTIARVLNRRLTNFRFIAQAVGGNWISEYIYEANILFAEIGVDAVVLKPIEPRFNSNFFSSRYEYSSYSPDRHDPYYIEFCSHFNSLDIPFIFHDKPLAPGKSLSLKSLSIITSMHNCVGIKVHNPDILSFIEQYQTLGPAISMFDGFGKTLQLYALTNGASARHSCWSWFDPTNDASFYSSISKKNFTWALGLIQREWAIAQLIKKSGFLGYNYLISKNGFKFSRVRQPGESSIPSSLFASLDCAVDQYRNLSK